LLPPLLLEFKNARVMMLIHQLPQLAPPIVLLDMRSLL